MALVANTYTTYNTTGIREDLSDVITNISPDDTPFLSGIGRTQATNTLHEWLEDQLDPPGANAQLEGDDTTFAAVNPPSRLSNVCQIQRKSFIVSGTMQAVNLAGKRSGRGTEFAYQVALKTRALATDAEYALLNNTTSNLGNATTARQMKGVAGFITTNVNDKASTAALTQDDLNTAVRDAWERGGKPNVILCGSKNKQNISSFTTGVTKNIDARDRRLTVAVDVFESDFGVLRVVPSRIVTNTSVYFLQMDLWKVAWLRPPRPERLAKTGDAEKWHIIQELTLEGRAERGNAAVINTQL